MTAKANIDKCFPPSPGWPRAAPLQFRYPECEGRVVGPGTWLFSGCVPRDDATGDFGDFVAFLAARRAAAAAPGSAAAATGRLQHFIIWNEVRKEPSSRSWWAMLLSLEVNT